MTELSRSFPKVSLYLILHEHLVNFSRNITIDWIDSNKQRNFTLWNQFRIDLNKTIGIRKKRKLFEVSFSDTSRSSFRCKKKNPVTSDLPARKRVLNCTTTRFHSLIILLTPFSPLNRKLGASPPLLLNPESLPSTDHNKYKLNDYFMEQLGSWKKKLGRSWSSPFGAARNLSCIT